MFVSDQDNRFLVAFEQNCVCLEGLLLPFADFMAFLICCPCQLELIAKQYLSWLRMDNRRQQLEGSVPSVGLRFIERLKGEMVVICICDQAACMRKANKKCSFSC